MPRVTVRPAVKADAPAVVALLREVAVAGGTPADRVRMTVETLVRDGFGPARHFETLVAEVDGRCVGCVVFFPKYNTWLAGPGLYVEDLGVAPEHRNQGVGRSLLAAVARLAAERNCVFIDLAVEPENPARRLYERIGMRAHHGWLPYRMDASAIRALARGG